MIAPRLKPKVTEKSLDLAARGVYQFNVPLKANKSDVARWVGQFWGVTVAKVTTHRQGAYETRFRQKLGRTKQSKIATVTLKSGQTIAEFSPPKTTEPTPHPDKRTSSSDESSRAKTESTISIRSKKGKKE